MRFITRTALKRAVLVLGALLLAAGIGLAAAALVTEWLLYLVLR
jgi:hypothetical protein